MKQTLIIGSLFGLLFGFIAWLIGFLFADTYLQRDAWISEHDDTLSYIEDTLTASYNTADSDTLLEDITTLEQSEDASISVLSPDALATPDTVLDAQPERLVYYDIVVNDSLVLSVGLDYDDDSRVPAADWLQLALIAAAMVCTVWVTALLGKRRLRVLEDTVLETTSASTVDTQTDPVKNAIDALQTAKEQITQLQHARQSAIEDHRDLLASVAHEFRNPLARLQFANEMAMERSGDEQQALFEEANIAARELDALVRETLHYSRLRSLDNILEPESLTLGELLQEMRDQHITLPDGVEFSVKEPADNPVITIDRRLMIRALTNLASNAARYAATTITLDTRQQESHLQLNLVDDGPGIDTTHATRIFEPFYRVGSSRSRESGGFGLGLSIVKSLSLIHI